MAPINKQCAVCSEPGKLCGSCENIHYCGPVCQKADWKVHKLLCRSFKAARDPPGPDMMRVIAFPFHSAKPEFLWMPIRPGKFQRPIVGTYFDSNINLATDTHSFAIEPSTGKKLPLRVAIQTRDTASSDGSLLNRAIYHLTGGTTYQQFAGPVLAYGRGIEGEKDKHVNLDTTHLNVIKDWFTIGFHVNKNEKAYLERYDEETEMFGAGISKECADDFEKELLANNETSPTFTPQDFNNPAFFEWYEKVEQFKQKWVAKKQAEQVANGIRVPVKFPHPIGEEELAWRTEMRMSGRVLNHDIMMHIMKDSAARICGAVRDR
ncbi:unnamed protein product [Aureobasidium pullulans]|uniref:MYND-type domain-containing protein n=1 Tax=Aureobasidium pullulans TaxID=5580 RepID=A0A4S8XEY7_AURPU|nr:hypothetical protein D6D22_06787 [Aureobasidium pullulans]CAC9891667.1 unnamed protein product [Aureobasidium pullulans]